MPAASTSDARPLLVAALLAAGLAASCTQTHTVLDPVGDGGRKDSGVSDDAGGNAVTAVSAATDHTCAIAGGALYCWGTNGEGWLGVGDTDPRPTPARVGVDADWKDIQVGDHCSLGLKGDGTIWSFGANNLGQLGQGDLRARNKPEQIGARTDWIAIATRFEHACALTKDGSLWCWGHGDEGQLGQDDSGPMGIDRPNPTQVTNDHFLMVDTGQGHTCAIRRDHTLWCWGRNSMSILGLGAGASEQYRHPVKVGEATDWQLVRSGQSTTCGLRGGLVYCWGDVNDHSVPGSGSLTKVPEPTLIGAPAGATGLSFNTFGGCSFDGQGAAACWGRNVEGQLGQGDMSAWEGVVTLPISGWTSLSSGRFYTCGIRSAGLWCTGDNRGGQIAQGNVDFVFMFMEVKF